MDKEERRAYRQAYYQLHKERIKARVRAYRAANLQRCRERENAYAAAHREEAKLRARLWQKEHKARVYKNIRRWASLHPDRVREWHRVLQQKRLARKKGLVNDLTLEQTNEILSRGCFFLSLGDCSGPLSVAHDIPLVNGGNTTFGNLFCLCRKHNSAMGTKSLAEMIDQLELF